MLLLHDDRLSRVFIVMSDHLDCNLQPDVEPDSNADSDEDKDGDEDGPIRSAYVGRGNVQVVRAARKQAGLSESFPRSDSLLSDFAEFVKASGAAEKDISNKVMFQYDTFAESK